MIEIINYKWAGKFLFFKIKTKCSDCDLITGMLRDMEKKEFKGKKVKIIIKPWLDNVLVCFFRYFAFRAPIVIVNGKKFSEHDVPDRRKLKYFVLKELKTF